MNFIPALLLFFSWPFSTNEEAIQEINAIKEEMKGHYSTNLDSAALLAEQILIKSKEAGYELGQAKGEYAIAHISYMRDQTSKAIPHFLRALDIYKSINSKEARSDQAKICISLGSIYRQHQSFDEAINFNQQGIELATASDNKIALRKLLYNLSIVYRKNGDLVQAINALTQSMDLISKEDNAAKQRTYNQFGLINRHMGEYQEARRWYQKMIVLDTLNTSRFEGQACHNIATTYREENMPSKAREYYRRAIISFENYGKPKDFFITYSDMAELALAEGKNLEAKAFAQNALALIHEVPNSPDYYNIYKLLSQSTAPDDPEQAITYANQFIAASEAFNNQQKELLDKSDKYKVQLIASNYFNQVKREKQRLKMAWTASCAGAFVFLAIVLAFKLLRIYNYRSPELALSQIKNPREMHYLLDLFRKENEEMKNTLKQQK